MGVVVVCKATCLWVLWTTSQSYLGLPTAERMHVHRLGEASSSITSNVVRRGAPHTCVVVVNLVRGCNKEWQGHVFVGSMDHIPIILGSKFLETPFTERMHNYFATCCEHATV